MEIEVPREVVRQRTRAVRRKMSFERFKQLPRRLGWKHEYYGGRAYIKPSYHMVVHVLDLARRRPAPRDIRPLTPDDEGALVVPFLTAFAQAPEYATFPLSAFRKAGVDYVKGFFGNARGERSPASVVAEAEGRIVGAALVKDRPQGPLLDCLFVVPQAARKGLATGMVDRVVNHLLRAGQKSLTSYAMLANEPSLAWHRAYGFREVPDVSNATMRWRHYAHLLEQHGEDGSLAADELARLAEQEAHWREEMKRLRELEEADFWAAHPRLE